MATLAKHPSTDGNTRTVATVTVTATHMLITRILYGFEKTFIYSVVEHTNASRAGSLSDRASGFLTMKRGLAGFGSGSTTTKRTLDLEAPSLYKLNFAASSPLNPLVGWKTGTREGRKEGNVACGMCTVKKKKKKNDNARGPEKKIGLDS